MAWTGCTSCSTYFSGSLNTAPARIQHALLLWLTSTRAVR